MELYSKNGINKELKLMMLVAVVVRFGKTGQFTLPPTVLSVSLIYAKQIEKVSCA